MPSEDTLIFLAIDNEFTNMDAIIKALEDFFQTKSALDSTDRFNLIFFTDKGPMYFDDFTFKWDFLLNQLRENKEKLVQPNFEGGLFIALTFILDIFKLVSGKYFRILVIKDGSVPPITKDFLVNNLIDKVKPMPAFLDVVVLGMYEDPDEDKILSMIQTSQDGLLTYATTFQEFTEAIRKEAENKKEIEVGTWEKGPDYKMDPDHAKFFENLSADLENIDQVNPEMKCTVCFKPTSPVCGTDALVNCPSCKTTFHDCCLVDWSNQSNIGIENVFRCPICFYLIKLPSFLVNDINNGQIQDFESFLEEIDQDQILRELDEKRELNLLLKELEF